ncbi:DUF4190 domain-containing protein [Streptomyces sp. NPDC005955]|uniref:DUF4190 domain-containing protein n=1 Tax=Streptomyces sp. NPDC005955 TaxID=3364738 RepID=UPI00368D6D4B
MSGLAITALVFGILCFLPAVGLVLGVVALSRMRRTGERGKAMAVWGIALSCFGLLLHLLVLLGGGWDDVRAGVRDAAYPVFAVDKGDCFTTPGGGLAGVTYDVDEVSCAEEHDGEAFGSYRVSGADGAYPGDKAISAEADVKCYDLRSVYAMDLWAHPADVDVYYFTPTPESWKLGDREVTCMFGSSDGKTRLTGSLRNDAAMQTGDQLVYLQAARHLEDALEATPEAAYVEDDLPGHQEWAAEMSEALVAQTDLLRDRTWPQRSASAVAALVKDLDAARKEWDRAARATDADTFYLHYDKGMDLVEPAGAVPSREALDLGTTPPPHLVGDPEDSGDGGAEGDKGDQGGKGGKGNERDNGGNGDGGPGVGAAV